MIRIPAKISVPYSFLKWVALISMTYDHVLKFIFKIDATDWILFPGRFAFPIFVFLIAHNLAVKEDFLKYIKRLAPFALLTLPVDFYFPINDQLNILFSFMLAIALIWSWKKAVAIKNKPAREIITAFIVFLGSCLSLFVEYSVVGIIFFIASYGFFKSRKAVPFLLALGMLAVMAPSMLYAGLIVPFGMLLLLVDPVPSPKPSPFAKTGWMFYAYYPLHKLLIGIIALFHGL